MTEKKPAAKPRKQAGAKGGARVRGLTPKQQVFVNEYLVDLNGKQAAIRAGYAESRAEITASELVRNRKVADAIEIGMKKREQRTEITQDKVLRELARIGFADIRKAVAWGNTELRIVDSDEASDPIPYHGLALKSSDEIDDDTAAAISEVSQTKEGLKVKFHDKKGALVDIGRHLGLFEKDNGQTAAAAAAAAAAAVTATRTDYAALRSAVKRDGEGS